MFLSAKDIQVRHKDIQVIHYFYCIISNVTLYHIEYEKSSIFDKMDVRRQVAQMKSQHAEKYRQIGLKISYYRRLKGFTQEQLAERIDKNVSFLGAVEAPNVYCGLSLDTLFDIAEALDVPTCRFFESDM